MDIAVMDYGAGNIMSVCNALESLNADVRTVSNPKELKNYNKIILPGVGSFAKAMETLTNNGWIECLNIEVKQKGKLFLGICLGLQLLAETGTEHGLNNGLGWIEGKVEKIESNGLRLPHIGWNTVKILKSDGIYKGIGESADFYFVNSYALDVSNRSVLSGVVEYGNEFTASVQFENIFATQFHPEKSHKIGLKLLENFINMKI